MAFEWQYELEKHSWEEGKVISFVDASYRHRIVVTCYAAGRQQAFFLNGKHAFGAAVELIRPDRTRITQGNNIIPVLPDGRVLMVVEQRPAHYLVGDQPQQLIVNGDKLDLTKFGPLSSVEFPGGAVDNTDQSLKMACLRELIEETGVGEQTATLYERLPFYFPYGSDVALAMQSYVIYLSSIKFDGFVHSDGGLHVLALSEHDVQENIWSGHIRSAQAGLISWAFYQELTRIRHDEDLRRRLSAQGYLRTSTVTIKK